MTTATKANGTADLCPTIEGALMLGLQNVIMKLDQELTTESDPAAAETIRRRRDSMQNACGALAEKPVLQDNPRLRDLMDAQWAADHPAEPEAPEDDGPDEHGVSEVTCKADVRADSGANFAWRLMLGDPESTNLRDDKLCMVKVFMIADEDMESYRRHGSFAYSQSVDMGNGYHAVSELKFAGMYDEWEANPDEDVRKLIQPFRDELQTFLENHPRVGHVQTERFVNGRARFEFEVLDGDDTPELRIILERGDN
jgi:hypothetical protein